MHLSSQPKVLSSDGPFSSPRTCRSTFRQARFGAKEWDSFEKRDRSDAFVVTELDLRDEFACLRYSRACGSYVQPHVRNVGEDDEC